MRKSNAKTIQLLQVGSHTFLRGAQAFLLPTTWRTLLGLPFRFFPSWREIQYTANKPWLHRLPSVLLSTLFLYAVISIIHIGWVELIIASFVSMAGLASFALLGSSR